jgi:2-phosphosulfolactate phosphatase
LFGGCFATAAATVRAIQLLDPLEVTLVSTGVRPDDTGLEDLACADYLAALLQGQTPDPAPYLERARCSEAAQKFYNPAKPDFPAEDMDCCLALDRFDFALPIERVDGLLRIRK